MPLGWECRARLVKQFPAKPTERRGNNNINTPGPGHYEPPQILGGSGYSKIKRSPAYTFGRLVKEDFGQPVVSPYAPQFNVRGLNRRGPYNITHGVLTPYIEEITDKSKRPGPSTYKPRGEIRHKRPPAYSIRPAARPPYQYDDQWTPPPNMYLPPIPAKTPPAYTIGCKTEPPLTGANIPGPGAHDPNFDYVRKTKPSFSLGGPHRKLKSLPNEAPPPNFYCEKKFMVNRPSAPAPSFGIRHSPYIGQPAAHLKPSKIDLTIQDS